MKNYFKLLFYCITFIAAGAAAAFFVYKILNYNKTSEVPVLKGKSITEASELLNKRELFLNIGGKEHDNEIKEGHIIRQDVEPGKQIPVGTEINVFVSNGPEMYSMPSFEGQVLEDARLTLINLGMKIRKLTWVHSDTIKKGRIIAQRPLPGNIVSNEINFLVSLGHYAVSYKCPSFVNMTIEDAKMLAKELGIKLIEKESGGRVIFQKPEADAIVKRGGSVEVTLGRGWGMWF